MSDGLFVKVLVPKHLESEIRQAQGLEIKSRREVPDDELQMGAKEIIEILAFLTTSFEVVKLSLEMLRAMKRSGNKDERVVLQLPRGGATVEIYEYEEEIVIRRKVERLLLGQD